MQQGWFIGKAECEASWHKHREGPQQPLLSFAGSPEALGKVLLKFPALVSVDVRGDLGFSGCFEAVCAHKILPACAASLAACTAGDFPSQSQDFDPTGGSRELGAAC